MKNKKWLVIWFTWLSWAWKTTLANNLYETLKLKWFKNIEKLDWNDVRKTITKDLWFSKTDRDTNIERIWYIANILSKNNIIVLASFITPYKNHRDFLRNNIENYIEVFIDTPLEICEKRDNKGLYEKARKWLIKNFTWISDNFDLPTNSNLVIKNWNQDIETSSNEIYNYIEDFLN